MLEAALRDALCAGIRSALEGVSDHIIRVDASQDWPISDALHELAKTVRLRVLVRRPFNVKQFQGLDATKDAGVATGWRNEKRRKYSVVIVGSSTGNLDAGLKDVKSVDRRAFVDRWRDTVLGNLTAHNDLNKEEVRRLIRELFLSVADGALPASSLETYIGVLLASPNVQSVCEQLWNVGLMADPRALDQGMAVTRARRNRELVDTLRTSDDPKIDRLLERAIESGPAHKQGVAKAAAAFREEPKNTILREIDLPTLEEILTVPPAAPSRSMGLVELLNNHREHSQAVLDCLERLAAKWHLDEILEEVEDEFSPGGKKETVRLELKPTTAEASGEVEEPVLAHPWTGDDDASAVLASQSNRSDPEGLSAEQQQPLTPSQLLSIDSGATKVQITRYLEARGNLRKFEPWLDRDALWLLLLHSVAREAVRAFIAAWVGLADAASRVEDNSGLIETVQVLETVQGPLDGDDPSWIVLGSLHPFRLDPLLRVADQTSSHLIDGSGIAMLGDALAWTLDRCFPAYPTLHRKDKTLTLSSYRGLVVYRRNATQYLPTAGDSSGLDRVLRAIEGFSPWLQSGLSILAIDPPLGGGVSRALERARRRREGRRVSVYHLATGDDADPLESFEGDLRYLPRVPRLDDAADLPPVNAILRFVPENPSSGEAASPTWQATRGTHLALEIGDAFEGPFGKGARTRIKIDPRAGNVVVRRLQDLYARFKAGRPVLATIRPLLQTDDAPTLSRLSNNTDWLVFAAPGPLGLISPKTINNTLRFVGRATMGRYGLYAYASDDLFPVRRHFEAFFRKTPVASLPPEKMVELLVSKAQESGHAVLFSSLGGVPAQVASLVALDIAQEDLDSEEQAFALSLDDMGWTRAWLLDGLRADFVVVTVKGNGEISFRVVESKSQEAGQPTPCDPSQPVYQEAIEQVRASLEAIKEITAAPNPSLDEDLRFASLIEHLMAAVLSRSEQLQGDTRKRVFDAINALSRRERVPKFEGLAILTQAGVNKPRESRRLDDAIKLVWAGAPEIARTFGIPSITDTSGPSQRDGRVSATLTPSVQPAIETSEHGGGIDIEAEPAPAAKAGADNPIVDLANGFIAAAKIHGIPISQDKPAYIQAGPSLFALGIRLKEGSSIQPLRVRIADIARDIGLGDRANEIDVENDSEPRTVRVLLPRPDREFPSLPRHLDAPTGADGYLPVYIGKTVDGRDYVSSVESWPHMLVAGTTGSGKTTFIRTILKQLASYGADRLQIAVVDGKGDTDYFGLVPPGMFPDLFPDVQLGHGSAISVLQWAIDEMEARRTRIIELARKSASPQGVKAADIYKAALRERRSAEIKPLVLVVDEFAEIMLAGRKSAEEFESLVQRISQVGRSRLIHLVLATQRPDKETIRGAIKANLNARAVFRLPTQADSMTVMGQAGAERLMLHGDMLFQHGTGTPTRLQAYRL